MAELKVKIQVEIENIEHILGVLPDINRLPFLTTLEVAGTATLIHNFYNSMENILKQIIISKNISIPQGASWHRDLIILARDHSIICDATHQAITQYLAFRHFFVHAYALELYTDKLEALIENIHSVFNAFVNDIKMYL